MMNKLKVILIFVLMLFFNIAHTENISVKKNVTWITPGYPEVHLLLKNPSDRARSFSLFFDQEEREHGGIKCRGNINKLDRKYRLRHRLGSELQTSFSDGIVPAKGWTHRVFRLGAIGYLPPCQLPYTLTVYNEDISNKIKGEIAVKGTPEFAVPRVDQNNSINPETLDSSIMVEKVGMVTYERILLRILLENKSSTPAYLFVSDRELQCGNSSERANWDFITPVPQGLSAGPVTVKPKGWAVLLESIRVNNTKAPTSCVGWIELSTYSNGKDQVIKKVEFSLQPYGKYIVPVL